MSQDLWRSAVEADLRIEVDAESGARATAHLTSDGDRLRLLIDHPEVLVTAAGRVSTGAFIERLVDARLHVEVHGPRGRVATVDPHRRSHLAALFVGSPHVGLSPVGWLHVLRTVFGAGNLVRSARRRSGAVTSRATGHDPSP